jgi:hypothetical protein
MALSDSFFGHKFGITEHDLQSYLDQALSAGGDYADLYFEYLATSMNPSSRVPSRVFPSASACA